MLHKCTIFLLIQIGLKVCFVLAKADLGDEYYYDFMVGANDGYAILKGEVNPQIMNSNDNQENTEKNSHEIEDQHSHEENKIDGEKNNPKWNFKRGKSKKEVRGFDLTVEEKEKFKIWNDGVIPYYIDIISFGDKVLRDKIRKHLQMVNSATGVRFVELDKPPDDENERWVFFMNRRGLLGCGDHNVKNFTLRGVQRVVLGYDCMSTKGELAEAVMSILGIPAEHNAPDRDQYISIQMDNIMPGKQHLFEKLDDKDWLFHDLQYDFNSVTHYDLHKYSANGRASIILKLDAFLQHDIEDFKPGTKYSPTDLRKIKMLYSYMVKKAKIQTSVCEKLFEIDKVKKSNRKRIKSRHKPGRYLGIPQASSSSSSSSSDTSIEKGKNTPNELNADKYTSEEDVKVEDKTDNNQNQEKRSAKKDALAHHWLKDKKKPFALGLLQASDHFTSEEEKNTKILLNAQTRYNEKKKKKQKKSISSLLLQSDYDTNEIYKKVPLKRPVLDPLTLLSDYQTDEGK